MGQTKSGPIRQTCKLMPNSVEMMLKVRSLLARRVDTAPVQDRPHYKAMLYAVTQMIDQTDYK